jgi:hypothetical protein
VDVTKKNWLKEKERMMKMQENMKREAILGPLEDEL